jgi:hypothetical protein
VRSFHTITFYCSETGYFAKANLINLATKLDQLATGIYWITFHLNSALSYRCDIRLSEAILEKLTARVSALANEIGPLIQSMLPSTPPAFQMCMHTKLTPQLLKIQKPDATLIGDVLSFVKLSPRYAALTPVELPGNGLVSRAVRSCFLLAHSYIVNRYSAKTMAGSAGLVLQVLNELIQALSGPGTEIRCGLLKLASQKIESMLGVVIENPTDAELCMKFALIAIDAALDAAVARSEPMAVEYLAKIHDLYAHVSGGPQPGPLFLSFTRTTQLCLFHNAVMATQLMNELIERLPYSIASPPDCSPMARLGDALGAYLNEIGLILSFDRTLFVPTLVDSTLGFLNAFLHGAVRSNAEFYEAKLRKIQQSIDGHVAAVNQIRQGASGLTWDCSLDDVEAILFDIESQAATLAAPEFAEEFPLFRILLSRSLLELESLVLFFEGLPDNVVPAIRVAAYGVLDPSTSDQALLGLQVPVLEIRESLESVTPSANIPDAAEGELPARAAVEEKARILKAALDAISPEEADQSIGRPSTVRSSCGGVIPGQACRRSSRPNGEAEPISAVPS